LRELNAAGAWGGLLHVTLCSFSARKRHVKALPAVAHAAAAAGTAAASRREPWRIGSHKWARRRALSGGRVMWEVVLQCPVLTAVTEVVAGDASVQNARKHNIGERAPRLHMTFGAKGAAVRDADMARFLSMLQWDVALVRRQAGDRDGVGLAVRKRWAVGPRWQRRARRLT
jgi:hypothetical protein